MSKAEAIKIWSIGPKDTVVPLIAEVPSTFGNQAASSR
jgi:hypothetical protein